MLKLPRGQTTDAEQAILRKLRVWISALAVACLAVGIGIGTMLAGKPIIAQNEIQVARAPEALSASFAEIARRVEPAVVNIDTVAAPDAASNDSDEDEADGPSKDSLPELFRRFGRRAARGVGSGFIVDPKGYILTNHHVVEGATRINVKLQSGEQLRAEITGTDEETDLAVIKVNAGRDLPTVKIGDSNSVQVGDWVLAIGSPFGLEQTVTAGIISTKERETQPANLVRFLQTDAAINRGNSGGPLVNMRGEVIGVNSQIATSTGDYNGIGFAVPSREVNFVYRQLVENGKVRRGYLGVYPEPVKAEFARVYGLPEARGAIIADVRDPQSPAAKAGLQPNDIIIEINGEPISNHQDLVSKVAATPVGQTIQVVYLRETNGKLERNTASVTVGERPPLNSSESRDGRAPAGSKGKGGAAGMRPRLGLNLSELTPQLATEKKLVGVRGLLIRDVDPNGIAADAGVRPDEAIVRINRLPVATLADFERVVNALKPGDAIVLHVATPREGRVAQRIVQFTFQ